MLAQHCWIMIVNNPLRSSDNNGSNDNSISYPKFSDVILDMRIKISQLEWLSPESVLVSLTPLLYSHSLAFSHLCRELLNGCLIAGLGRKPSYFCT